MSRIVLAATLVAAFALAACSAAQTQPEPTPSANPANPSAEPSAPPTKTPSPIVTPRPADPGSLEDFTAAERYLFNGVLRGASECQPAAGSDDMPRDAIAGIECTSEDPAVSRIGFYLFENDAAMLDAYVSRMTAEGVALDSGSCSDGEGESAYTPGEGTIPYRNGCFIDGEAVAIYGATLPGSHVSIQIRGRSADGRALEDFAWLGNQDTPGSPTLWGEPS
jgi:ABC-type transport system substrate-binding protein